MSGHEHTYFPLERLWVDLGEARWICFDIRKASSSDAMIVALNKRENPCAASAKKAFGFEFI